MLPADTTPVDLRPEPHDSTKVSGSLQVPQRGLKPPSDEIPPRPKILLCYADERRREYEAMALRARGFEVIECSPALEMSAAAFQHLLQQVTLVRFDVSVPSIHALAKLSFIFAYRKMHDMKPMFVCISSDRDEAFHAHIERVLKPSRLGCIGGRERIRSQHADGVMPDLAGWGIEITHRFWSQGTICQEGEEVWDVATYNGHRRYSLPFATMQKVVFDHWAHGRIAQTTSQWAAGLKASQFVQKHGARGSCRGNFRCHSSRNGMKQHFQRMGPIVVDGFKEVGIEIDKSHIIERIPIGREVKYRLHPGLRVIWKHKED